MRILPKFPAVIAAAIALSALTAAQASACPTCYGRAEGPVVDGMNWAILAMIGITGFVLSGVAAMFVSIGRRMRRFDTALHGADHHNDNGA